MAEGQTGITDTIDGSLTGPPVGSEATASPAAIGPEAVCRAVWHACFLLLILGVLAVARAWPPSIVTWRSGYLESIRLSVAPAVRTLGGTTSASAGIAEPSRARLSPVSAVSLLSAIHPEPVALGTGGAADDILLYAMVPHTIVPRRYRIDPISYTVQSGDSVYSIAATFGVSPNTILWNNGNLEDNPDYLSLGDVLTILPVSGVYHTVLKEDTLESIAAKYKVEAAAIRTYEGNYLREPWDLLVGQKLIVPGGVKPYQVRHVVAWSGTVPAGAKRGTGVFGWPVSGYITQRFSDIHQAVDVGVVEGSPVKAADTGYVALVGRNDTGYGRYILIDHANGFQTLYAHLSVIYVELGQSVSKGQMIARSGNTGKSTGPHLHFEIKLNGVRRNPFVYLK